MIKFYQYPKCSTCIKARRFLDENNIKYQSIDITVTPPTKSELKKMLKFYNGDIKKLFNTSGVQYRELQISEKLKSMDIDTAIDLLNSNGKLVKRPFILGDDFGIVGAQTLESIKNSK